MSAARDPEKFGDAAAQSFFLHGATGILLLLVALICLMVHDAILARVFKPRDPTRVHA